MNAERLNRWLTLGANLGVLVGLILLVVEIRQTSDLMRAQTRNELSKQIVDLLSVLSGNAQLADVMRRAWDGENLTPDEYLQYEHRTVAMFRYWENVYYQYRQGTYDETEFTSQREAWKRYLQRDDSAVRLWKSVRELYSPNFRGEIDTILPKDSENDETTS